MTSSCSVTPPGRGGRIMTAEAMMESTSVREEMKEVMTTDRYL